MKKYIQFLFIAGLFLSIPLISMGQDTPSIPSDPKKEELPAAPSLAPEKIDIKPTSRDGEIKERLTNILNATGWFQNPTVEVNEGVVFINGLTKTDEFKKWAGDLARNTQDVSAVVNKIDVEKPSIWNFQPTLAGLKEQWIDLVRILPTVGFGILIFFFSWFVAWLISALIRKIFHHRVSSLLLLDLVSRSIGICIIILGLFIIFRMLGLTTVAFTIIGGTGLIGIILGIAFKDITENLLASVFLSIYRPFRNGDLVEILGIQGYVQRLTIRSTVLISLDGKQVQIPNATVYKNNILNFSVNPNRQESFSITIGDDVNIPDAQQIALKVLSDHPAIVKDPEPLVLVDSLEKGNVILRIYYWIDGNEHSWLKVKSSIIRLIKHAFQEGKITMPCEKRLLVFSSELPVRLSHAEKETPTPKPSPSGPAPVATSSEAGLKSDSQEIKDQALNARLPEKGEENFLDQDKAD